MSLAYVACFVCSFCFVDFDRVVDPCPCAVHIHIVCACIACIAVGMGWCNPSADYHDYVLLSLFWSADQSESSICWSLSIFFSDRQFFVFQYISINQIIVGLGYVILGRGVCIGLHGFRGPNARTLVAFKDSVDRTPELSLRSRIPWTERQKYRCVAFTDSVNRMPGVVIASTDFVNSTPHESCELLGQGHGFRHNEKSLWYMSCSTIHGGVIDRPGLYTRIPWTEGQNSSCVHRFRGPKARILVAFTDSVDRTPELTRIPWTERQKYRSRIPWTECWDLSLCPRTGFRGLYSTRIMRIVRVTDSDAMQAFQLHVFHTVIRCNEYRMSPN
jgi:hypothetical protein